MKKGVGKTIVLGGVILLLLAAVGAWVLVSPGNPLTRLFRSKISDTNARIIVGPYPIKDDFPVLQRSGVTTIVSLLDHDLPYERLLLNREKELAEQYKMTFLNFPMGSIMGKRFGEHYTENARKAAEAIRSANGKVYLHCYLGVHRIKSVQEELQALGTTATATYQPGQAGQSEVARELLKAQTSFEAKDYQQTLEELDRTALRDTPAALLLRGWSLYHLGRIEEARDSFQKVVGVAHLNTAAYNGLGYCELRKNELKEAESHFAQVLKEDNNNVSSLTGMGFVRYRQGNFEESLQYFQSALKLDPRDNEVRQMVNTILSRKGH